MFPDSVADNSATPLGPLTTLSNDSDVTDVFVLANGQVFAARGHGGPW